MAEHPQERCAGACVVSASGSGSESGVDDFADFTEGAYRLAVMETRRRYRFEPFGTRTTEQHVLWRHDVDVSVHRAARLAAIEAEEGATATYFFALHSPFYNLLERQVTQLARTTFAAGNHWLGLHFDTAFYGAITSEDELAERVSAEARFLADLLERPVEAFSFHNPDVAGDARFDSNEIGGLVNAYGRSVGEKYRYVSDSNGYWRFVRLLDVVRNAVDPCLHVLTHPEWWQAEPMPPRARIVRAAEGRAARALSDYDAELARGGRANVR